MVMRDFSRGHDVPSAEQTDMYNKAACTSSIRDCKVLRLLARGPRSRHWASDKVPTNQAGDYSIRVIMRQLPTNYYKGARGAGGSV